MAHRRRRLAGVMTAMAITAGTLVGCGGSQAVSSGDDVARTLDDLVRSIAGSQEIDESLVRSAIRERAESAAAQRQLAEEWDDTLPAKPLPKLSSTWDDLSIYLREQLEASTCEAVLDMLATGDVPNGQAFFENYVNGALTGRLPAAEERAIMDEFDLLYRQAVAGDLDANEIRFSLMKLQYC